NDAPEVGDDPDAPDAAVGEAYSFELPDDTFVDPDEGDELTLTASEADGSALPGWLDFDPATGEFSGTPDAGDLGEVSVAVQAVDEGGLEAETTFSFEVLSGGVTLLGDEEVNALSGGPGNDLIQGEGGADVLSGGAGADRIEGGAGGDRITGGAGDDILRGDPEGGPFSQDFFVYEGSGDALDRIRDFEAGEGGDVLVLDDLVEGDTGRVSVVDRGNETAVRVDSVDLVVLEGVSGTSLASLVDDGNLTVGASA
ncbi:MAG TPA: putative Ig domain-containing protein, partial [Geminicoccaceae bacterium]